MIRKTKAAALELPTMTELEKSMSMSDNLRFIKQKAECALEYSSPQDIRALLDDAVRMGREKKNPTVLLNAAKIMAGMQQAGITMAMDAIALERKICSVVPDNNLNVQINNVHQPERALPSVEEAKSAINRYVDILGVESGDTGDGGKPAERTSDLDRKLLEDLSRAEASDGGGVGGRGRSDESEGDSVPAKRKSKNTVSKDKELSGSEKASTSVDPKSQKAGDNDTHSSFVL